MATDVASALTHRLMRMILMRMRIIVKNGGSTDFGIPLRARRERGILEALREASEGEARRLSHRGRSCPSRECLFDG